MREVVLQAHIRRQAFRGQTLLRDVHMVIPTGTWVILGGPNGAGKTTLLRCILGLLPFEGEVHIAGFDVRKQREEAMRRVGYVPQQPVLFPEMTVMEHIWFFAALRGVAPKEVHSLVKAFELEPYGDYRPTALSGGWRQRLSFALALIGDPQLLLLDEPTAHLDRATQRLIQQTLVQKKEAGCAILMTTHRLEDVEFQADRLIWMENGQILGESSATAPITVKVWVQRPSAVSSVQLPPLWRWEWVERDGYRAYPCLILRGPADSKWDALLAVHRQLGPIVHVQWMPWEEKPCVSG